MLVRALSKGQKTKGEMSSWLRWHISQHYTYIMFILWTTTYTQSIDKLTHKLSKTFDLLDIDVYIAVHVRPVLNIRSVSNVQPVFNVRPVSNFQPVFNVRPVSNAWLFLFVPVTGYSSLYLLLVIPLCTYYWLFLSVPVTGYSSLCLLLVISLCTCVLLSSFGVNQSTF